jgi:hypothetical protein
MEEATQRQALASRGCSPIDDSRANLEEANAGVESSIQKTNETKKVD